MTKRGQMFDFGDGFDAVPAHRHPNGGGWVAETAAVDPSSFVSRGAVVYGRAIIGSGVRICGKSSVCGTSHLFNGVVLEKSAHVYGSSVLREGVYIGDKARVGYMDIQGCVSIKNCAEVGGGLITATSGDPGKDAFIVISGRVRTSGGFISGCCRLTGDAEFGNGSRMCGGYLGGRARVFGGYICDRARVTGGVIRGHVSGDAVVKGGHVPENALIGQRMLVTDSHRELLVVGPLGRAGRYLTLCIGTDDELYASTGCFDGTLCGLLARSRRVHGAGTQYYLEYRAAVQCYMAKLPKRAARRVKAILDLGGFDE